LVLVLTLPHGYNKLPHPVAFSFLLLWQTILKKMYVVLELKGVDETVLTFSVKPKVD